ncbi:MAG: hypothetical protein QM486_08285 [Flavobacteriaceae bacterium]
MKNNLIKYLLALFFSTSLQSCSVTKNSIIDTPILEFIRDNHTPKGIIKLKKKEFYRINHQDTLTEKEYDFSIPKEFKNFSLSLGTYPIISGFNYSKGQKIIIIENNIFRKKNVKLLNLNKIDFVKYLDKLRQSSRIKTYLDLDKIKLRNNRKFGIIEKTNVLYLLINVKDNDITSINFWDN